MELLRFSKIIIGTRVQYIAITRIGKAIWIGMFTMLLGIAEG